MAARTYIPALIMLVKTICRFMSRYDAQIRANINPDYLGVYSTLHDACDAFEAIIPVITPPIGD